MSAPIPDTLLPPLLTQSGPSSECFIAFHVTICPHRIAGCWGFLQAVRQRALAWYATCPCQCAGRSRGGACRMSGLTKALRGVAKALLILVAFALCVVILWKIKY